MRGLCLGVQLRRHDMLHQILQTVGSTTGLISHSAYTADPNLVRQITIRDFNKFHDRVAPGLNRSLFSGKRMEAVRSGMLIAT